MASTPGEWREKEPLSAAKLNANDALNVREVRTDGRGLGVVRTSQSVTLRQDPQTAPVHIVRGHVTSLRGAADHPLLAGVTPWDGAHDIGPQLWTRMIEEVTELPSSCDDAEVFIVRPYYRTGILDPNGAEVQWAQVLPDPTDQLGIVVCHGPCGENDFPDSRYHVLFAKIGNTGGDKNAKVVIVPDLSFAAPDCGGYKSSGCFHPKIVTATHLHEYDCDTHLVRAGTPVVLRGHADAGFPGVRRWIFQIADLSACYPACPPPAYCCSCYEITTTADTSVPPIQLHQVSAKVWKSADGLTSITFTGSNWLLTMADGTKYTADGSLSCPPTDASAWTHVDFSGPTSLVTIHCCTPSSSSSASSSSGSGGPCCDCYQVAYTADDSVPPIQLNKAGANSWTSDDDSSYIEGDDAGNWTLTITSQGGDTGVYTASGPCPPADASQWTLQSGSVSLLSITCCPSSSSGSSSGPSSASGSGSGPSGSGSGSGCDCGPIPCPPAGDGDYVLQATMTGGVCSLQWVAAGDCGGSGS